MLLLTTISHFGTKYSQIKPVSALDGETLKDVNIKSVQRIIERCLLHDMHINDEKDRKFVISQIKKLVSRHSKPNEPHGEKRVRLLFWLADH